MRSFGYVLATIIAAAPMALLASPAASQNFASFVSRDGSDSNACTEAAPCAMLLAAYNKTNSGGTIYCLDTGFVGFIGISKSITIDCKTAQGSNAAIAHINTAGIQVVLRGLVADGGTDGSGAPYGIVINAAATVVIEDCAVRDAKDAAPDGYGVLVANPSGTAEVSIKNCNISGARGGGIRIAPTGSGSAKVTVSNSNVTDNGVGIRVNGDGTSGDIDLAIVDTVIDGNTGAGIAITGGSGQTSVLASRVAAANNGGAGMSVANANTRLLLDDTNIFGNAVGTEVLNGGLIRSYGNNTIIRNVNNGAAPPVISMQ